VSGVRIQAQFSIHHPGDVGELQGCDGYVDFRNGRVELFACSDSDDRRSVAWPWRREHGTVASRTSICGVISSDRASLHAKAATKAAPQAVQVADHRHLLRNMSEALVGALGPHHRLLAEVARTAAEESKPVAEARLEPSPAERRPRLRIEQNRERRMARYQALSTGVHKDRENEVVNPGVVVAGWNGPKEPPILYVLGGFSGRKILERPECFQL
jgi:hypothetical protein